MANNPHVLDNLKPFTTEKAREGQLKGAKIRHENCVKKDFAINVMRRYLMSKKTVTKKDVAAVGENGELKEGKKATRFEILFYKVVASLENRAEMADRSVERDFSEIMKACGAHYDQSAEALGGAENPINVNNRIGPPSEEYKEAMRDQASMLGIIEKGN